MAHSQPIPRTDGLPNAPMTATAEREAEQEWTNDRSAHRASFIAMTDAPAEPIPAPPNEPSRNVTDRTIADRTIEVRTASHAFEVMDQRLATAEGPAAIARERLAQEFDAIVAMSDIADVTLTPDELVVTTHVLTMADDAKRYDIGAYRIHISRRAVSCYSGITIEPLHGRLGMNGNGQQDPHPYIHIVNRGPCWGNLGAAVSRAVERQEFDVLVELCLILLTAAPAGHLAYVTRPVLEAIGKPITT
ncbi:hypothetical protein HY480_01245 [Candidatus Uhrbacteria bacterium]|nr:hypothetical protein [Candidatus Uhrbacteria bacterium]